MHINRRESATRRRRGCVIKFIKNVKFLSLLFFCLKDSLCVCVQYILPRARERERGVAVVNFQPRGHTHIHWGETKDIHQTQAFAKIRHPAWVCIVVFSMLVTVLCGWAPEGSIYRQSVRWVNRRRGQVGHQRGRLYTLAPEYRVTTARALSNRLAKLL